jgi:UDP-N-acetylmuramoyl-L-alanyl-D-glutamate--2,6-diaminopimelate ligase
MEVRLGATRPVRLQEVLPTALVANGGEPIEFTGATVDSRCVQRGDLFVAIRGSANDGHQFLAEAQARGAVAAVVETPQSGVPLPQLVVSNTRQVWAELCWALAGHPERQLQLVGITGTNGKTTTSFFLRSILQEAGLQAGLIGTMYWLDGHTCSPSSMTTPGPSTLSQLFSRMACAGCRVVVMEVSSHALAQDRVAGLRFQVAIFTNLSRDHLDYHPSFEAYAASKRKLFGMLMSTGCAVLNAEDPWSPYMAEAVPGMIIWYGFGRTKDFSAEIISLSRQSSEFELLGPRLRTRVRLGLPGRHNVLNALAASAAAAQLGCDARAIREGLQNCRLVPGRLEHVGTGLPFDVYVDYAHTPAALEAVLTALRDLPGRGRILCVFGAGGNRDPGKRRLMGQVVGRYADLAIVTTDNPRFEQPEAIVAEICAGFEQRDRVQIQTDRRLAIELALELAQPGDVVLIAGKGHEQYQLIRDQRLPFDDRQVVREWVAKRMPQLLPGGAQTRAAG